MKKNVKDFEEKYLNLKETFKNQGKKIKVLKELRQRSTGTKFHLCEWFYIQAKHVEFHHMQLIVDASKWDDNFNQSLRIMTFGRRCKFDFVDLDHDDKRSSSCANPNKHSISISKDCNLQIETLRFIDFDDINTDRSDLLENQMLIESLNLHNSVKNLTLCIELTIVDDHKKRWERYVSNLLTKKYYFNLENVNILLYTSKIKAIDRIFDILKKYQNILKHQFKQLNIGIQRQKEIDLSCKRVDIIKWNSNIDDKFLDNYRVKCYQYDQSKLQCKTNADQYQQLIQQWVS